MILITVTELFSVGKNLNIQGVDLLILGYLLMQSEYQSDSFICDDKEIIEATQVTQREVSGFKGRARLRLKRILTLRNTSDKKSTVYQFEHFNF